MSGIENHLGFILAGIIINLTPGADSIYIITRSIAQGRKAGIYSVLGISSGAIIHIILAAFGLSILVAKSALLFNIIKWTGAAYLIYLGIRMLMDKSKLFENKKAEYENVDLLKIYRQGFTTNILNPKVGLFSFPFYRNSSNRSMPIARSHFWFWEEHFYSQEPLGVCF